MSLRTAVGFRLGHVEGDLKRLRIEPEQDIALADELVLDHLDRDHPAVDVRADRHHVGLDVGVLGRDVAAAHRIPVQADEPRERRDDHQEERPDQPAPTQAGSRGALRPGVASSCTGALPLAPVASRLPLPLRRSGAFDDPQRLEQLLALGLVQAVERLGAQIRRQMAKRS